jgi:hypothetical protein
MGFLSVEGIRECFESGVNPNGIVNAKPLIYKKRRKTDSAHSKRLSFGK